MLSDIAIRNAKADPLKTLKLSDGGGLQLWVTPTGSKLWNVAYRFEGKQRKLSLGPTLPSASRRRARSAARHDTCVSKSAGATRRLLALAEVYDGGSRSDAARIGGVGPQTVRDWMRVRRQVSPTKAPRPSPVNKPF